MNNIFRLIETDLASRRSAANLRSSVESCLLQGVAVLDLSQVQSISESYADEFFGVLVDHYSLPWVFSRLKVEGANQAAVRTITQAIRYRLEQAEAREAAKASSQRLTLVVRDAVQRHESAFAI